MDAIFLFLTKQTGQDFDRKLNDAYKILRQKYKR